MLGTPERIQRGVALVRFDRSLKPHSLNEAGRALDRHGGLGLSADGKVLPEGPLREAVSAVLSTGESIQVAVSDSGQSLRWVLSPENPGAGKPTASVMGTLVDLSAEARRTQELMVSAERMGRVLDAAECGWWENDIAKDTLFYSDDWWRVLGYQPGDMPSDTGIWRRFCHPGDLPRMEAVVESLSKSNARFVNLEFRMRHRDGHYLTIASRAHVERDASGKLMRMSGINHDVTEQRRIENALRESEDHLRQLFNTMSSGFSLHEIICDKDGKPVDYRFVEVNAAFEQITGLKRSNVIGRRVLEVLPDTEPYWIERFCNVAITGKTDSFESFSREFGRHYSVNCYSPKPGQFAVLSFDVTDRVLFEENLRKRETRFLRLIENSSDLITIVDAAGLIVYQSPSIQRMLGYAAKELVGKDLFTYVHPDDVAKGREKMAEAFQNPDKAAVGGFRVAHADGSWREISAVGVGIPGENQIVINARDVTDQRRLEMDLRQSQKMEALGRLSGGIAHDFNNLLTAIKVCGNMLMEEPRVHPEDREMVLHIMEATDRAAALTQQLLTFGRRQALSVRTVDINRTIGQMAAMLKRILGEDVDIRLGLQPEPITLKVDPGMIEQVILNLAVNARDAMPGGGQLEITSSRCELTRAEARVHNEQAKPGLYARITVADTGQGIPPDVLPKIFEPFFTTKEAGKGTGIGLATVHGIVVQHSGLIKVSSEPGKGTRFELYFPVAVEGQENEQDPDTEKNDEPSTDTVLILEEDPVQRDHLQQILSRAGFRMLIASDGYEAMVLWHQNRRLVRLLLASSTVQELGGADVARRIRSESPGFPAVLISPDGTLKPGESADVVCAVRKDAGFEELPDLLRKILARGQPVGA